MKHPKWLLLSWIPVLVALTLISNEALAEHWQWKKLSDSDEAGTTPPARALGSAIYDPLGNRVIVFGGRTGSTYLNDLWAFDLDTLSWVELVAQGTPPTRRRGHNAIYDPMGHRMVSWAGQGSGSGAFFDDVWALDLDSNQWQDVSPVASPPGRYGSTSVFDPVGNRLVSFGGFSDQGRFDDVQAFDLESQTWQNLAPEVGPVKRCLLSSAIDLAARKMIIFGGQSTEQSRRNDLWVFDFATNSWTEAPADAPPSGRFFTTSFVDSGGSFIVFGGSTAAGNSNETWRYDFGGGQWTRLEIPDPPSPRSGMAATLIGEDKLIIFSGSGAGSLEDVWELSRPDQGHLWFAQFGNGMGFSSAIVLTNTSTTEQTEGTVEFSDGVGQGQKNAGWHRRHGKSATSIVRSGVAYGNHRSCRLLHFASRSSHYSDRWGGGPCRGLCAGHGDFRPWGRNPVQHSGNRNRGSGIEPTLEWLHRSGSSGVGWNQYRCRRSQ